MLLLLSLYVFLTSCFHTSTAAEIDLNGYESSFYSPSGEDGVLARIFASINPSSKFCVECGAGDGITNSLTYLLRNQEWKAVLFDRLFDIPAFNLHKEFITARNVNALFQKYNVPETFDLLTIDIGYNDFYVWQAIDARYRPAVVCITYNGYHTPQEDKIVIHHPYFCGDDTHYFGASMLALYHLGQAKGYDLVYAEKTGRRLFFVRQEQIAQEQLLFKNMNDVKALYRPLDHNLYPSRLDLKKRLYMSSQEALK